MAKTEKIRVDYHKMDVEKLAELVASLGENTKGFKAADYVAERPAETKLVDIVNADGKPKYYVGKDGKTKIKKKKVAVGDKKEKYFNLMAAKRAFYDLFREEFDWYNTPKVSNKDDNTKKVAAALASLGVEL